MHIAPLEMSRCSATRRRLDEASPAFYPPFNLHPHSDQWQATEDMHGMASALAEHAGHTLQIWRFPHRCWRAIALTVGLV